MLMKNLKVQLVWPPVAVRVCAASGRERTFGFGGRVFLLLRNFCLHDFILHYVLRRKTAMKLQSRPGSPTGKASACWPMEKVILHSRTITPSGERGAQHTSYKVPAQ